MADEDSGISLNRDRSEKIMSYSPAVIANYFLDKASDEGRALTPMQLIKLVYIAHGWHLGYFDKPLIDERIEAWKFGPVISSLYNHLKHFGSGAVVGKVRAAPWATIDDGVKPLLDRVWEVYKGYSGLQLSAMTHKQGTPWYSAWVERGGHAVMGRPLSDAEIKQHYKDKIAAAA